MDLETEEEDTHEELAVLDRPADSKYPGNIWNIWAWQWQDGVGGTEDERIVLRNPNTNREERLPKPNKGVIVPGIKVYYNMAGVKRLQFRWEIAMAVRYRREYDLIIGRWLMP